MSESLYSRMSRLTAEDERKRMKLFHKIEGATAIVRAGVIHKQLDLYHRGDVVYIPYSGGYLRTVQRFGEHIGTAKPEVHIIDWEAVHRDVTEVRGVLKFKADI